jgi:ferredoxin
LQRPPQKSLISITIVANADSNGDQSSFAHSENETVLETLERNQIVVQYHCRDGFCGACRSKLICGEVEYTTDPLAFIDDDEFLPCCTKPNSDITIEIE